jgi:transcription elongation factor GreA-like protein
MRGKKIGFIYHKTWKTGIIQCVSVDFPGHYAIFLVKDSTGTVIPVDSRDASYV